MAAGAEHLKERVSEYLVQKRAKPASETFTGTLGANWNEERFDSRLVSTGGKRAALPTELDHTWRSTYGHLNDERQAGQAATEARTTVRQVSATTAGLLDTLSGKDAGSRLSQARLIDVVDGRKRAFPGHQPEQDLPGKDGRRPGDIPATSETRETFLAPEEHRRRQQVNAADMYHGPAHDKAAFVVFKLQQALKNRGVSARQAVATANAPIGTTVVEVRQNFSYPGLRKAMRDAERAPPVPGIRKRDGFVTQQELGAGLEAYGIPIDNAELVCLFKHLDRDGSGEVSISETVATIRGSMNDRRRGIVTHAFRLLETTVGAQKRIPHGLPVPVTLSEVMEYFDAASHPCVIDGRTVSIDANGARRQLFEEFYNLTPLQQDGAKRGIATLDSFRAIYDDWSALVDADHYFERCVRDCWHLSGGEGHAANTSCRRVRVVHTNGRITDQIVKDDLGIDEGDEAAMRANLQTQGIKDVKRISILPRPAAK